MMEVERAPNFDAVTRTALTTYPVLFRYGSRRDSIEVQPAECAKIVARHAASDNVQRAKIERMVKESRSDFLKCLDYCSRPVKPVEKAVPGETAIGAAMRKAQR